MHRYAGLVLIAFVTVAAAGYSFWVTPFGLADPAEAEALSTVENRAETVPAQAAGKPGAAPQASAEAAKPLSEPGKGQGPAQQPAAPGDFDFYVLSLSWSPTFCGSEAGRKNSQQCGTDRKYGLIVHGLWPQREKGYPESCKTGEPGRVPEELGRRYFDLMPGMGLIGHEWRKHGTCSGLGQADYFALVRKAYERIRVPQEFATAKGPQSLSPRDIESRFITENPGLSQAGISVQCEGARFEEVRICLTKDLGFRECQEVDRQACSRRTITIPAMP